MFQYEIKVTDKILKIIKNNQEFLVQPENLPQLSKLGYMFDALFYVGRICYGFNGIVSKSSRTSQCENNPKYELEKCEPKNPDIESKIYDAWGMHIGKSTGNFQNFKNLILKGQKLSPEEKSKLKLNKTFEEWYDILYRQYKDSIFPDRKSILDFLFCVIGNGYSYANGYIYEKAGGAKQNKSEYGDWKNAKFSENIEKEINKILSIKELKVAINKANKYTQNLKDIEYKKEEKLLKALKKYKNVLKKEKAKEIKKYSPYYPICEYSSITKINEKSHPSYLKAALEICNDILKHQDLESKGNIKFANKFLKKYNKK